MKKINISTIVKCPFDEVVKGFNENLFRHLVQGFPPVFVERFDGLEENCEAHLRPMGKFGPLWVSVMCRFDYGKERFYFEDYGKKLPWPLKSWKHHHIVEKVDETFTKITDDIELESYPGIETFFQYLITQDMKNRGPKYKSYFVAGEI